MVMVDIKALGLVLLSLVLLISVLIKSANNNTRPRTILL